MRAATSDTAAAESSDTGTEAKRNLPPEACPGNIIAESEGSCFIASR